MKRKTVKTKRVSRRCPLCGEKNGKHSLACSRNSSNQKWYGQGSILARNW